MADIEWTTIYFLVEWVIRLIMAPIVVLKRDRPVNCLAWLTAIFFLPIPGLFLYMLLADSRLGKRRRLKRLREYLSFDAFVQSQYQVPMKIDSDRIADYKIMVHLAERTGGLPITSGNAIQYIRETDQFIDELIAVIDAAEHHVHLLYYIYADDEVGKRVAQACEQAVERGVHCRVLMDSVGSRYALKHLAQEMRTAGVQVVEMLPVRIWRRPLARIDLRNHRKLAVVDGNVAMTGSHNMIEGNYGGHSKAGQWQDITAKVTGPVVAHLQLMFLEDWYHETSELVDDARLLPIHSPTGQVPIQVVPSGPDLPTEHFQDMLVEAVHLARHRVVITSPYFIPDEPMLVALRMAAARGVKVELILPRRSDSKLVDYAGMYYCDYLVQQNVEIYRFEGGLLHAKTMTIDDDFAMFGTSNFDIRSFHLNFELNLLIHDNDAVERLRYLQVGYKQKSHRINPADIAKRPLSQRLAIHTAKLFSPLL